MFEPMFFFWNLLIFDRGPTSVRQGCVPDMATSTKAMSAVKAEQKTGRYHKVRAGIDHGVSWKHLGWGYDRSGPTVPEMGTEPTSHWVWFDASSPPVPSPSELHPSSL